MGDYYVLDGNKQPVKVDDVIEWAEAFENKQSRRVAWNSINGIDISTMFLGLDHNYSDFLTGEKKGPPLLFETMVFGGKYDQIPFRTSTWDEALLMHSQIVQKVKGDIWGRTKNCWKMLVPKKILHRVSFWAMSRRLKNASKVLKKWKESTQR